MNNKEAIKKITDLGKSFEQQINELKKSFSDIEEKSYPKEKKYDAKSLMARLTSVQACCEEVGVTYQSVLDKAGKDADSIAFEELKVVALAFGKGQGEGGKDFVVDYKNKKQHRYFPVFDTVSGFSFLCAVCVIDFSWTYTNVGGRLCFATAELAEFAGRTFLKKYAIYFGAEL